jgi:2-octaprenylphenol hydroxylase
MIAPYDVAVIGGGIVGLTAALAMAQRDVNVVLIDAYDFEMPKTTSYKVFALNAASQHLFAQLGVWSLINNASFAAYQRMHIWDALNHANLNFDARMIASHQLGVIIDDSVLKNALLQKIHNNDNITCCPHSKITTIKARTDAITIATQTEHWQAKLLLIADGSHSNACKLLTIPMTSWSYHQHAVVAQVRTEKRHQHTAYQLFNPEGPLAFLPLVDDYQSSIVWSTTPTRANQLTNLDTATFNQQLATAFAHRLGNVMVESRRYHYPLVMRHTQQYVGPNWLLLGDAAHTIHPLAGLGLNIGLADIQTWLNCFDSNRPKIVSKRALTAYQQERKYEVWKIIAVIESLKTIFANTIPPFAALRGLGLNLCNQLNPLKRFLIEQAAGKRLV